MVSMATQSYGQTRWIDSLRQASSIQAIDTDLVRTYIRISDAFTFYMPDSGLVYGGKALDLANKLDWDVGKFWSMVAISGSLFTTGNYALQLDNALKAQPLGAKLNDPYTKGFSQGMLSDAYFNLGEFATSFQYLRKVQTIGEMNDLPELHLIYSGFTPIFINLKQYDSALKYALKGFNLFRQSKKFNESGDDASWSKGSLYYMLAEAYLARQQYDSALLYYHLSVPYSETLHMSFNLMNSFNGIAHAMLHNELLDSATFYVNKAMNQTIARLYPAGMMKSANLLADIYERKGYTDSSLKTLRLAIAIKDSIYDREKTMAFQNILFKEQEKQRAVSFATIQLKNRYKLYSIAGLAFLVIVTAGIMIRNRRRKQLEMMRSSIADDLHDDIGSGLSSISILSELAMTKTSAVTPLLASISENAMVIQENMSDIVWSVKPRNDHAEHLLERMQLFATPILEAKNIKLSFEVSGKAGLVRLTMEQRKNLYLFFKEAVNNVAKHSDAANVSVYVLISKRSLELLIRDDGRGFDPATIDNGNGMLTLNKRAVGLNGRFTIVTEKGKGTFITLLVNLK